MWRAQQLKAMSWNRNIGRPCNYDFLAKISFNIVTPETFKSTFISSYIYLAMTRMEMLECICVVRSLRFDIRCFCKKLLFHIKRICRFFCQRSLRVNSRVWSSVTRGHFCKVVYGVGPLWSFYVCCCQHFSEHVEAKCVDAAKSVRIINFTILKGTARPLRH